MGLDMQLIGTTNAGVNLELGYWRKHPNLHGYIVQTFAHGVDECQPILLSISDMEQIITTVQKDRLPHTTGFFFGTSYAEEAPTDVVIFTNAIVWIKENGPEAKVIYQASW